MKMPGCIAASSSGCDAAPSVAPKPKVSITGAFTPKAARDFLPPADGCRANFDSVRHNRWQIEYKSKPSPPYSVSKVWGEKSGLSQDEAFRHCLKIVWAWHKEVTGVDPPFDLDTVEVDMTAA
jgi:hypothetical protein